MQTLAKNLHLTIVGCQRLLKERHDPQELELIRRVLANAEAQLEELKRQPKKNNRESWDTYSICPVSLMTVRVLLVTQCEIRICAAARPLGCDRLSHSKPRQKAGLSLSEH